MKNLTVIYETNLLNVPATLRNLADAMERGEYGEVRACVVAWEAAEVHVSYCGRGEAGPNAHLLLHVAAAKMVQAVLEVQG
jgi:hypothetical protein